MKKLILSIFTILIFFSCKNDDLSINKNTQPETSINKSDINKAAILPEALEYYSNIAEMAKWYAKHKDAVAQNRVKSESGDTSINTLIAKLDDIDIIDSANVKRSFFELTEARRDSFLSAFVIIEANELSKKLNFDTTGQVITSFSENNMAVKAAFAKIKTANGFSEDPYWKVRNVMTTRENARAAIIRQEISKLKVNRAQQGPMRSDNPNFDYLKNVWDSNTLTSGKTSAYIPPISAEAFVNQIRGSIVPGRLLISLPGGFDVNAAIILNITTMDYDVGHVAVMNNIAPTANYDYAKFTRSTNSKDNMHDEVLNDDWCKHHRISFVGQVFDYKWVWFYKNWHNFGYNYKPVDVDNGAMARKINSLIGTPYVNFWEIPVAKWVAPDRLMCSTAAWWCAKTACDVNISNWYNSTILPGGVFLSDRVRIIDNTFH